MATYVIGIDYGSDSARALIVDTSNGVEVASSVKNYPRWSKGLYCDPAQNRYRQHPQDYIDVLEEVIADALRKSPAGVAANVVGISFDTTGSTPVLVDRQGTPLALLPGLEENPNAMFILWKDHTAVKEADEINRLAARWDVNYTRYEGGIYSSEWVWAKVLHVLREDPVVREAAYAWIEHCDWMGALLTGKTRPEEVVRSRCAAGHKAMWHESWGGLPSEDFLVALDPLLAGYRDRLFYDTYTADQIVGTLTPEWAKRLGLSENVVVGVGAFDCHMGAVGGGITPNILARAIGTSTCDILIVDPKEIADRVVAGICGQVDGSVMAGYVGLEAGQSGFGDIYAWFKNVLAWGMEDEEAIAMLIPRLSAEAAKIPIEESTIVATDWMNGRRTPDADQNLKGTITGLTLASTAPRIFRALVEATCFGSRAIVDRFRREGVSIEGVIAFGGVAKKSPFVMQTMADVMNIPIRVARSEQTCALGAAMFAAVAAGVYPDVKQAQQYMAQGFDLEYKPLPEHVAVYERLYKKYLDIGSFTEKQ